MTTRHSIPTIDPATLTVTSTDHAGTPDLTMLGDRELSRQALVVGAVLTHSLRDDLPVATTCQQLGISDMSARLALFELETQGYIDVAWETVYPEAEAS